MTNTSKIYQDLIQYISEVTGETAEKLNLSTTINQELHIYGDDWNEIMMLILDQYPIHDFSDFEFNRHMKSEGSELLFYLIETLLSFPKLLFVAVYYLFSKEKAKSILKKRFFNFEQYDNQPLYIADIYNSVLKGKWEYAIDSDLNLKQLTGL